MKPSASATLRRWAAALLVAAVGLAACDGGEIIDEFRPTRLTAFGDEWTMLTAEGRRFGINFVDDEDTLVCGSYPVWVQSVTSYYGLVFAECNPNGRDVTAQMRAIPGARVEDLRGQLLDFLENDSPGDRDMVTVMVGTNDVLELYARFPELTEDQITAELEARGRRLAQAINRVADAGPRVIALTVPDIGYSPFALAERLAHNDTDRARLLRNMVSAFNGGMRLEIRNDGRQIGLVFADDEVENMATSPSSYGLRNVTAAACADAATPPDTNPLPLLGCTNAAEDLVEGASATTWLWADTLRLAPTGQARLGRIAVDRAQNNPF